MKTVNAIFITVTAIFLTLIGCNSNKDNNPTPDTNTRKILGEWVITGTKSKDIVDGKPEPEWYVIEYKEKNYRHVFQNDGKGITKSPDRNNPSIIVEKYFTYQVNELDKTILTRDDPCNNCKEIKFTIEEINLTKLIIKNEEKVDDTNYIYIIEFEKM